MNDDKVYTLPSELASGFINNDWSILDYIGDKEYDKAVAQFVLDIEREGLQIIDVVEDSERFIKYHDMKDYGVLACDCSDYIVG